MNAELRFLLINVRSSAVEGTHLKHPSLQGQSGIRGYGPWCGEHETNEGILLLIKSSAAIYE